MSFLPIIVLSGIFLSVAFLVTEKNAKYLLSGFNTLSEKEQEEFDLPAYLTYFKRFHVFLGISVLLIGVLLELLIGKNASIYLLIFYPPLAYINFLLKTWGFYRGIFKKALYPLILVLGITLLGIGYLLLWSNSENSIGISQNRLIISGSYGFEIPSENIEKIALVDSLPQIIRRTNGVSTGQVNKGKFKSSDGRTIRLFLNNDKQPRILILAKGREIYYSSKNKDNSKIYQELVKALKSNN